MPEKILLISWTIPPETTGSSIIVANLAKQFTSDEMIIFGERPLNKPEISWNSNLPKRYYVFKTLPDNLRGVRWIRRLLLPFIFLQLLFLAIKHKIKNIIVVFPNKEYLFLGYLLSILLGKKFFPYFHNTYLENRSGVDKSIAKVFQKMVFKRAKKIFVMSEGMKKMYQEQNNEYIDKIVPLVHTFNEEIPQNIDVSIRNNVKFCFSGNINKSCLDAGVRLFNSIAELQNVSLKILTGSPKSYFKEIGVKDIDLAEFKSVSRDNLVPELREGDIMLLPHGFNSSHRMSEFEIKTIFPTKTIEYLISGKPILAHCPTNCFIYDFLNANQCALIITDPDKEAVKSGIQELISNEELRRTLVKNAFKTARQFQAKNVADKLKQLLN